MSVIEESITISCVPNEHEEAQFQNKDVGDVNDFVAETQTGCLAPVRVFPVNSRITSLLSTPLPIKLFYLSIWFTYYSPKPKRTLASLLNVANFCIESCG